MEGPARKRRFLAVCAGSVLLWNYVPVRVDFRVAENGGDPIFKPLRDDVLQPLCLLVHFVPGILQDIVKKQFEQAVMSHQFPRPSFPSGTEPNTPVLFIQDQGRLLRCKPLKHAGHRRRPNSKPLGKSICRYAQLLGATQFEDGFQVIVNGFRSYQRDGFSCHYFR